MANSSSKNLLIDKFAWAIMGLALSIQPLLGFPFSIIAVIYGLTYRDTKRISYVRLGNVFLGIMGTVLSVITLMNGPNARIDNIYQFELNIRWF